MEQEILATIVKSRDNYALATKILEEGDFKNPQYSIIYKEVGTLYGKDSEALYIPEEALRGKLKRKYKMQAEKFEKCLGEIFNIDVSKVLVFEEIRNAKIHSLSQELALELHNNHNSGNIPNLWARIADLRAISELNSGEDIESTFDVYEGSQLRSLIEQSTAEGTVNTGVPSLNKLLCGGLERQRHVVLFARPEIGKTSFAISLSSGILRENPDARIVYLTNEDPPKAIIERHIQCMLNKTREELQEDFVGNLDAALNMGLDRLVLIDSPDGSMEELECVVKEKLPLVLIIDQVRNIRSKEQQRVMQLEDVARHARTLAKKYNMISISITQAGDSAENKGEIGMHDVDSSKTGIPASACIMLGFSATKYMMQNGFRRVTVCKNKQTGNKESFDLSFDDKRCRFEEINT